MFYEPTQTPCFNDGYGLTIIVSLPPDKLEGTIGLQSVCLTVTLVFRTFLVLAMLSQIWMKVGSITFI